MENKLPSLMAQTLHDQIGQKIKDFKGNAFDLGKLLDQMRDCKHYKTLGYSTFDDYCQTALGFTRKRAFQLIQSTSTIQNVYHGRQNDTELPQSERQTRELAKAPEEEQATVWVETQERTGKEQPTAKEIKETVKMKREYSKDVGNNFEILFNSYDQLRLNSSIKSTELWNVIASEYGVRPYFVKCLVALRNKEANQQISDFYNGKISFDKARRQAIGMAKVKVSATAPSTHPAIKHLREGLHFAMTYEEFNDPSFHKLYVSANIIKKNQYMFVETNSLLRNPFNQRTERLNFEHYAKVWMNKKYRPDSVHFVEELSPKIFISKVDDNGNSLAEWLVSNFNK